MDKEQIEQIQLCTNETTLQLIKQMKTSQETFRKILSTMIISITIAVVVLCGTVIYIFNNFEIQGTETTQTVEGDSAEIINGNQYKDSATHNQGENVKKDAEKQQQK